MNALEIDPELYDRREALGEARQDDGEPMPWDDEYWDGVLAPSLPAREEIAA